jgi:hypothetical protein
MIVIYCDAKMPRQKGMYLVTRKAFWKTASGVLFAESSPKGGGEAPVAYQASTLASICRDVSSAKWLVRKSAG